MMLPEMVEMFVHSRKRGTDGAKKQCSARTIECYMRNLHIFLDFLTTGLTGVPITRYENIKKVHVMQFLDWLDAKQKAGEWSRATVLQMLRSLKAFFRWIDRDEECQAENLIGIHRWLPVIEKNPQRNDMPQTADLSKFKTSFKTDTKMGYRNYVATCLMLTNGIRIGELCSMRIDHMKLDERTIIVDGKTGVRIVGITKDMVILLKGWMKRRPEFKTAAGSPYVFVSMDAECMSENAFGQAFRKHCAKHGLPRITAHTFRHMFSTNYLRNGGDLLSLKRITGHKSITTLEGYLHEASISGKRMQDELERVNLLKEV